MLINKQRIAFAISTCKGELGTQVRMDCTGQLVEAVQMAGAENKIRAAQELAEDKAEWPFEVEVES